MICDMCGYKNGTNDRKCRNCGAALQAMPSEAELSAMLKRLSDRSDALTASRIDRIMMWVSFAMAPVSFAICLISTREISLAFMAAIFAIIAGIMAGFPKAIWAIDKIRISIIANSDDMTPSDFWSSTRVFMYWAFIVLVVALVAIALYYG